MSALSDAASNACLCHLLRLLMDHRESSISPATLAEQIGCSPSEVLSLLEQLRAARVPITGDAASGYHLEALPDMPLPELVEPLVKETMFSGGVRHYFLLGSTNTEAVHAAQTGAPEGTVFFAEEQTTGHGRGGHQWHSERSTNIYVSILLRPSLGPGDVLLLSLMAGLATAAAVEEVTGVQADMRWPNDLLLPHPNAAGPAPDYLLLPDQEGAARQRKFVGILTEMSAEATNVRYAVVGIGINVNQPSFPEDLRALATSLRMESGHDWSRVQIAGALLRAFDREYRQMQQPGGREQLFRRFEEVSSFARGLRVNVDEGGGYNGVTEGLDPRGFLQVRADDGTLRTVLSGGVRAI